MNGYLRAEISVSAIRHNIALIRQLLPPGVKLCPVVKANAYGHGIEQILPVMEEAADMVGVAICSEAERLRRLGWQRPVLMFTTAGASPVADLAELIVHDVILTLTTPEEVKLLAEASQKASRPAEVHVKIDSGMTRGGIRAEAAPELVAQARQAEFLRLTGLYTHFACAEGRDKTVTLAQHRRFMEAVEASGGPKGLILHAANSAATIDLPQTHLDMVRPGMALYGYQPAETLHKKLPLKPSLRLTAPIVLIKDVPAGAATGYCMTYRFERDARVALVPVGYGDGYFRCFSNAASMRLGGVDCPVRGRVSMDQTIIEITEVPDAQVGQHVEVISPDPAAPHSVANLAKLAGTIGYEIITRLGDRISRVAVD
ncbi:MAG: hypothetical protein AMJ81_05350 [Phycisphaerae bacterium SM23_33]|jgi:alanine racemase|nr:MAG: hypothetical protein AMJ81_05350 [Phycisphaerae bacterium SM23_33]